MASSSTTLWLPSLKCRLAYDILWLKRVFVAPSDRRQAVLRFLLSLPHCPTGPSGAISITCPGLNEWPAEAVCTSAPATCLEWGRGVCLSWTQLPPPGSPSLPACTPNKCKLCCRSLNLPSTKLTQNLRWASGLTVYLTDSSLKFPFSSERPL